ncbi:hypothetical protein ACOMHN_061192 [Nucella lapillus]
MYRSVVSSSLGEAKPALVANTQPHHDTLTSESSSAPYRSVPNAAGVVTPSLNKDTNPVHSKPSKTVSVASKKPLDFSNRKKSTMLSSQSVRTAVLHPPYSEYGGPAVPGHGRFSLPPSLPAFRSNQPAGDSAAMTSPPTSRESKSAKNGGESNRVNSVEILAAPPAGHSVEKIIATIQSSTTKKTPTTQDRTVDSAIQHQPAQTKKYPSLGTAKSVAVMPPRPPKPAQSVGGEKASSVPALGAGGTHQWAHGVVGQPATRPQPTAALDGLQDIVKPPQAAIYTGGSVDPSYTYPAWWREAWSRTVVWPHRATVVGDQPLYPQSCLTADVTWEVYPFVEPKSYIRNSKNPCWYKKMVEKRELRCVPYFYLAGVAKCGTTDLSKRIRLHPDVFKGTMKEYHWWERFRFGNYDEEEMLEDDIDIQGGMTFKEYTDKIAGDEINDLGEELKDLGSSVRIFGDFSPSYLWDPRNWYVLEGNQNCSEPRVIVAQHIHHVFPQAKVILTFRHPTSRLYSRFLSRTTRTHALKKATAQDFNTYVVEGIEIYKRCFAQSSVRQCAYNMSVYKESMVRLVEGMYPVFMADWLRVWPRHNILLLRYEDYGGHEGERLTEIFQFLGLAPLDSEDMEELLRFDAVNSGSEEYEKLGPMLEETRVALNDFYQPFVQQFAQLVGDDRFLWKDVAH